MLAGAVNLANLLRQAQTTTHQASPWELRTPAVTASGEALAQALKAAARTAGGGATAAGLGRTSLQQTHTKLQSAMEKKEADLYQQHSHYQTAMDSKISELMHQVRRGLAVGQLAYVQGRPVGCMYSGCI